MAQTVKHSIKRTMIHHQVITQQIPGEFFSFSFLGTIVYNFFLYYLKVNCIYVLYGSLSIKGCLYSYSIAYCYFYRSMACQIRSVTKLEAEKVHLGLQDIKILQPFHS